MAKKSEATGAAKRKAAAPVPEAAPETAPKARKSRAKNKEPETEAKSTAKRATAPAVKAKSPAKTKPDAARTRKAKVKIKDETGEPLEIPVTIPVPIRPPVDDPIGDVSDGEARFTLSESPDSESQAEMTAYRADTGDDALEGTLENRPEALAAQAQSQGTVLSRDENASDSAAALAAKASPSPIEQDNDEAEGGSAAEPRPPAKLERLQKILSRAGIASRRHAEEMIEAGRIIVNGQVVAQLGSKADPARDHIRVDGKLISGAERHRYFVLNKPRGFVTTVSDPEGRPTAMQFFAKMSERLYPVGRLDYDSEGLLLVTNDGELANQLTRAASGVEKTYLVKVAGQPTEDELDRLRSGVPIEQGKPGSDKVHTAPAQIRQFRQGDNPWYEVVLIEGRNRELRKMFEQIGHHVEKIRRVGYGPLVLDLEPGMLRELTAEEVSVLRLAAEGKWKPRRPKAGKMAPEDTRHPAKRGSNSAQRRPNFIQRGPRDFGDRGARSAEPRGGTGFGQRGRGNFGQRSPDQGSPGQRSPGQRSPGQRSPGQRSPDQRGAGDSGQRAAGNFGKRPFPQQPRSERPFREKPEWKPREEHPGAGRAEQPPFRGRPDFASGAGAGARPEGRRFTPRPTQRSDRPYQRPNQERHQEPSSRNAPRPSWGKPSGSSRGAGTGRPGQRPAFKRFDQPNKPFDKPQARNLGERPARDSENRPPRKFDRPRSESSSSRPGRNWDRERGQRPAGNRAGNPGRGPAGSPIRREGSAPAFRNKFKPAPDGRPAPEGRERPASSPSARGGAPSPRSSTPGRFSKPGGNRFGFKGKPGGGKSGGAGRGGRPSGGSRPGGRKRG